MSNKYCPICGEENKCMSGSGEHGNCWCDLEVFPNEILELVPAESLRKHCICKNCLDKYKEDHKIS
ncbi:cysteine-rich CWC family protein [Neobacillus cucumis]|uniref:cysteine-rich CWC family protein n=1 Tax=Neobacillus cucumis TaxID=1740721 RepID=UPI0018E01557|nr:cysteine-rich CWC family protein [Neobacillus cucumis]MBI0579056.1 cysteine-rich CWC family protein [Neobacillus cucumis]WHY89562.1 cysteine-rich CWC family protein [Neobacillus cucumis]